MKLEIKLIFSRQFHLLWVTIFLHTYSENIVKDATINFHTLPRKVKYSPVFDSWSSTDSATYVLRNGTKGLCFASWFCTIESAIWKQACRLFCQTVRCTLIFFIQALPRCNITCNSPTLYDRFRHFSNVFPQIERQQVPSASFWL